MSRSRDKPYHHGDLKRALVAAAQKLVDAEGPTSLSLRKLARAVGVSHAAPLAHFPDRSSLNASLAAHGFRQLKARLEAPSVSPAAQPPPFPGPQPLLDEDRRTPQAVAPEWRIAAPALPAAFLARAAAPTSRRESSTRHSTRLLAASLAYLKFAFEHPGLYHMMYAPELSARLGGLGRALDPAGPFAELREEKARAFGVFVELGREGQQAGEFRKELPPDRVARLFTALAEGLAQQYLDEKLASGSGRLKDAEQLFELLLRAIAR